MGALVLCFIEGLEGPGWVLPKASQLRYADRSTTAIWAAVLVSLELDLGNDGAIISR
jgi:hypothetical protein